MAKFSPLMALPPLMFAGLAGLFVFGMNRDDPEALPSAFEGAQAPVLTASALEGIPTFDNETLKQEGVKLVNFWASWCPPCRAEHGSLQALSEAGIPIYGVTLRDDPKASLAFLDELGNPFTAVISDTTIKQAIEWGVVAPPETFIIDGDGKVVYKFIGPLVGSDLENRFRPELEKALAAEAQ